MARLAPAAWLEEGAGLSWGRRARSDYAACLARDGARGDAFSDARVGRLRAMPPVGSSSDVLHALRCERELPRFRDAAEVEQQLSGRLRAALARDAKLRERLGRLGLRVAFVLSEPDARIAFDLRGGARVDDGRDADIEIACTAEDPRRRLVHRRGWTPPARCGAATCARRVPALRPCAPSRCSSICASRGFRARRRGRGRARDSAMQLRGLEPPRACADGA